ncbi:MAG: hypothetical protein K8G79_08245 [bacterium]|uniref:Uncharacterized protein n=1 Tax=Candidatus Methylomirabilis tolerans TaxID=3123416 RepID=A0AAJ1EIE2_9BACT|nr:hypothetical protein [Candidatus Methylomirabilis sp.]
MIVCFNCDSETKVKMDSLMANDHYTDYSELIAVAMANLWMLDREIAEKGALVIGEGTPLSLSVPSSRPVKIANPVPATSSVPPSRERPPAKTAAPPAERAPLSIPDLFLPVGLDGLSVATVDIERQEPITADSFTLDRWLFGQYNKLLPAKANCRALVRLAAEHPDGEPLEETAPRIAEVAALLGDWLADYDRRHQIGRDDAMATAFPRSGPNAEKSRARYANQFVGSVNSQGALSGLLQDYRLAGLAPGNGPRLLPTKQGMSLARLANPILDGHRTEPAQRFSAEETAFLLKHIRSFVPVEAFAFRTLLRAIADAADTPDKLDEALRVFVPTDSNRSLSSSFLTSQRSGALSRMADLGLISRVRKGVRVSYAMTEQGQIFIKSK